MQAIKLVTIWTVSVRFSLNATGSTQSTLVWPSDHLPVITPKHSSAGPRTVSLKSFGVFWRGYSVSHRGCIKKSTLHWADLSFLSKVHFHSIPAQRKNRSLEQHVLGCMNPSVCIHFCSDALKPHLHVQSLYLCKSVNVQGCIDWDMDNIHMKLMFTVCVHVCVCAIWGQCVGTSLRSNYLDVIFRVFCN